MHDAEPPSLPPQYDAVLAAGATIGYGGLTLFLLTQIDPAWRVYGDLRFQIILWCIAISGPSALCWLLRPQLIHMTYAVRLGIALQALPDVPRTPVRRVRFAARRWVWLTAGTIGTCTWTLAAALDIGAASGRLLVHGAGLAYPTLILCQVGAVCITVRIMGPSLAAVDTVYRIAHRREPEEPGGTVTLLPVRRPS